MEQIFVDDLGKKPSELFRDFDPNPIAAASLAQVTTNYSLWCNLTDFAVRQFEIKSIVQVFVATTLDKGQKVAVKVQYADLRDRFDSDVATFKAQWFTFEFWCHTYLVFWDE